MKVRRREIGREDDRSIKRERGNGREEWKEEEEERRSREEYREGVQQGRHLSAADVIPKISSNNSRR